MARNSRGTGDPRLRELVERCLLALDAGDRSAVDDACADNPEYADAIREKIGSLGRLGLVETNAPASDTELPTAPNYRLIECIGHGGMGQVYLAEQLAPIRRRVALKVLKRGLDTDELLRRFDRERQALAVMEHAGIARVFDAGATDDGRPFFAMELVEGLAITKACERMKLMLDDRLSLLVEVCDAVQHAHHKGIVHRDLKPSNVLVVEADGALVPKIIDFGIAKAVQGGLGEETLFTEEEHLLGTPEYMSPEQAAGDTARVDTRTDVYALGVILFELLTGELPFESARLRNASPAEMRRMLREEPPSAPSSRVGAVALTGTRATPIFSRTLHRDLDWITLRALEKEPDRRYGSPAEFAADIERHLAQLPIEARPPSAWYRWRKFTRRNRVQVAAASAVALAIVIGLAVSLWALAAERAARRSADQSFDVALTAIEEMVGRIGDVTIEVPELQGISEELDTAEAALLARLVQVRRDDPRLRLRAAAAYRKVADARLALGHQDACARALVSANEMFEALPSEVQISTGGRTHAAEMRITEATLLVNRGEVPAGRALLQDLVADLPAADTPARDLLCFRAHYSLALSLGIGTDAVLEAFADARDSAERLRARASRSRWLDLQLAGYDYAYANALQKAARIEPARERLDVGLVFLEELRGVDPDSRSIRGQFARTHLAYAELSSKSGDYAATLHHGEEAVRLAERLTAEFPRASTYRETLAAAHETLARALASRADMAALDHIESAIAVQREQLVFRPDHPVTRRQLVSLYGQLAVVAQTLHDFRRPVPLSRVENAAREAIRIGTDLLPELRGDRKLVFNIATAQNQLGIAIAGSDPAAALEPLAEAARLYDEVGEQGGDTFELRFNSGIVRVHFGNALVRAGRSADAIEPLEEAGRILGSLAREEVALRDVDRELRDARLALGRAHLAERQHQLAASCAQLVLDDSPESHNPPQWAAPLLLECYRFALASELDQAVRTEYAQRILSCTEQGLDATERINPGHPMNGLVTARLLHIRAWVHRSSGDTEVAMRELDAAIQQIGPDGAIPRFRSSRAKLRELFAERRGLAAERGDEAEVRRCDERIAALDQAK